MLLVDHAKNKLRLNVFRFSCAVYSGRLQIVARMDCRKCSLVDIQQSEEERKGQSAVQWMRGAVGFIYQHE